MSDDKKLTLSGKTLGVGKGVESGQVRQNFSHGRSKTVVVERKKKRVLTKSGTVEVASANPDIVKPKKPKAFVPKKPNEKGGRMLTGTEQEARMKALEGAKKRAEEEAKERAAAEAQRAIDEVERKKREAAEKAAYDEDAVARQQAEADAKKKAEGDARKKADSAAETKAAEQRVAREKAEEEARKKADLEARAVQLRKASEARQGDAPAADTDARKSKPKRIDNKRGPGGGEADRNARTRAKPGDDRRRGGRLTISTATGGGERQRSLAAYKRAQAKKRAAMGGMRQRG